MKTLLKTLLNNGFFVLALLIAVTLYLAYGQKQATQNEAYVKGENTAVTVTEMPTERTPTDPSTTAAALPAEPQTTALEKTESQRAPAQEQAPINQTAEGTSPASAETEAAPAETQHEANPPASGLETAATDTPPPSQPAESEATHEPAGDTVKAQAHEQAEQAVASAPAADKAPAPQAGQKDAPAPDTPDTTDAAPDSNNTAATAEAAPAPGTAIPAADSEHGGDEPSAAKQTDNASAQSAKDKTPAAFDPSKINDRAILSYFSGSDEALAAAREAAHKGDYVWSAAIYSSLLRHYPRADLAGELGNVLWRMGEKQWAHRAWRYAAQLLIREGRIDIARTFARNIAKVDPALSREIEAHLPKGPADGKAPANSDTGQ